MKYKAPLDGDLDGERWLVGVNTDLMVLQYRWDYQIINYSIINWTDLLEGLIIEIICWELRGH